MCPYCYYKEDEIYRPRLYCNIKKGDICIYAKLCTKEEKFIPTEYMGECYIMNEEMKKNIPDGSNYVRFVKGNYVYVEINDEVKKIKNTIGEGIDNFVYVKETDKGYQISLKPFKTSKKH